MNNGTKLILLCIFYWIIIFSIDNLLVSVAIIMFLTVTSIPLILDTLDDIINRINKGE